MRVLLIGAGRYGNSLVGRKYVSGELGAKLVGVVDPKINDIKKSSSYCLNGVPTYSSLSEVSKTCVEDCIADIAIIPQVIPKIFKELVERGAKQVILPKPVTTNSEEYNEILNATELNKMDAVVASNWHYSNITKMTKALLAKLKGEPIDSSVSLADSFVSKLNNVPEGYTIDKVEVQYNKKNEVLTIDPPMQELPHALQIVYSTGCTDLKDVEYAVNKVLQSKSRVNVDIKDTEFVKDGITLNSDLQMKEKLDKNRERILKVHLERDGENVVVTADYDAVFDEKGTCLKKPSIKYENPDCPSSNWTYYITEDNMNVMYEDMFNYMQGAKNNALTVKKYDPISQLLCKVQKNWEKARQESKNKQNNKQEG